MSDEISVSDTMIDIATALEAGVYGKSSPDVAWLLAGLKRGGQVMTKLVDDRNDAQAKVADLIQAFEKVLSLTGSDQFSVEIDRVAQAALKKARGES